MYPLNVVLVNCGENALPHVRRELLNQNALLEAECADIASIVDALGLFPEEKRLFVFHARTPEALAQLRRLSGTFVGQPILTLLEPGENLQTVIAAMRAGSSQVVLLPLQSDDFRAAMECIAFQFGRPPGTSRVIAVSGATGGCGATTVAINLAYEMALLHGKQCILTELALQVGMLATYLDCSPTYSTLDLLRHEGGLDAHMVQQALTKVAENFHVMVGPHRNIAPGSVQPEDVQRLVEYLRLLAQVVILDVPCTYDDLYFQTLTHADQVVLVADQRIPSIRNLDLILGTLAREAADRPPHVVINRYDPKLEGFSLRDLEKVLDVPRLLSIANDFAAVNASINNGRPLRLEAPASRALADIDALARTLLAIREDAQQAVPSSGLLRRLMHAFSGA